MVIAAAHEALARYPLAISSIELINFEYNATFKVQLASEELLALRINVNSERTLVNALAEVDFVRHLSTFSGIAVPQPIINSHNEYVTEFTFEPMNRDVIAVLFSWLEGEEMGDEPSIETVFSLGATLAKLHLATKDFTLSSGRLPSLRDLFVGDKDLLSIPNPQIPTAAREEILQVMQSIDSFLGELYSTESPRVIHADLHGWNVMLFDGSLSVFDFDDSAVGLPIQDIAIATYYLGTDEERLELLKGYQSISPLPKFTPQIMQALLLHRRLLLLNYLLGSSNSEHREMIPAFLEKTLTRIESFSAMERE